MANQNIYNQGNPFGPTQKSQDALADFDSSIKNIIDPSDDKQGIISKDHQSGNVQNQNMAGLSSLFPHGLLDSMP